MISTNLQQIIRRAKKYAREYQHEFVMLEHLLMAMTEDAEMIPVFEACKVDIEKLRCGIGQSIRETQSLDIDDAEIGTYELKESRAFRNLFLRASISTGGRGRNVVTSADALVAFFSEPESSATKLLREQKMKGIDAFNYAESNIGKTPIQEGKKTTKNWGPSRSRLDAVAGLRHADR